MVMRMTLSSCRFREKTENDKKIFFLTHRIVRTKMWEIRSVRDGTHKMEARNTKTGKKVRFGAQGYSDYLQHKDEDRRQRYIDRHRTNENWRDPTTAGFWSRWILWGPYTSIKRNAAHAARIIKEDVRVV